MTAPTLARKLARVRPDSNLTTGDYLWLANLMNNGGLITKNTRDAIEILIAGPELKPPTPR